MTIGDRAADAHLRRAHAEFEALAAAPERVNPVRLVLGVVRAGLALAVAVLRARRGPDPARLTARALRP